MYSRDYLAQEPTRAEVDAMAGPVVLEFGAPNCGHCHYAQPALERALANGPTKHLKIEDGKGRALGRSFQVKLWPTVIFLRDGIETERLVRPNKPSQIEPAVARIEEPSAGP
jgi:thioredoxin 1